ncbi:hypothetical protein MMC12_007562, partial [Toensbergia leucococca]|nr:hypothetical protein [Toensbergia leucococca]
AIVEDSSDAITTPVVKKILEDLNTLHGGLKKGRKLVEVRGYFYELPRSQAQLQADDIKNSRLEAIANHNESAAFFVKERHIEFNELKRAFPSMEEIRQVKFKQRNEPPSHPARTIKEHHPHRQNEGEGQVQDLRDTIAALRATSFIDIGSALLVPDVSTLHLFKK